MASEDSQAFHWRYPELEDASFEVRGRALFAVVIISSVMLLATLFFFYARWVCTLSSFSNDSHLSSTSLPSDQLAALPSSRSLSPQTCRRTQAGLDVEAISRLPVIIILAAEGESEGGGGGGGECSICLGVFEDNDKVKMLPGCSHCFHADCIDRWLSTQSNCPLCRTSLLAAAATTST